MKMLADNSVLVVLALLASITAADAEEQSSSYRHSTTTGYSWEGELGPVGHRNFWANSASRVAIHNMPLPSAVVMAAKTGTRKVLVSQAAKEIIRTSDKRVSVQSRDQSQQQLLRLVLDGTSVRLAKIDNTIRLFADGDEPKQVEFSSISRLAVEHALDRHLPLHMDHVPIHMALEMVKGFTGLRITYGTYDDWSWMGGPLITIHANGRAVSEVLEDLASQVDCEVKVRDDQIELTKRETR